MAFQESRKIIMSKVISGCERGEPLNLVILKKCFILEKAFCKSYF